jgi:signal transduction histidine kinase
MTLRPPTRSLEWLFIAAMVVICGALSFLQYRWTGELARAETARLRANLGEQSLQLTRDFDAALAFASAQLLPTAGEIEDFGRDGAFLGRWQSWLATKPRPIFRRLAAVLPANAGLKVLSFDAQSRNLTPTEWPAEWSPLRENLLHKGQPPERRGPPRDGRPADFLPPVRAGRDGLGVPPERRGGPEEVEPGEPGGPEDPRGLGSGGSRPFLDPAGLLFEFPIFGGRGARESGWMIMELDADYLRTVWLPELVRAHLDAAGQGLAEITVLAPAAGGPPVFTTAPGAPAAAPDISLPMNRQGRTGDRGRDPAPQMVWTLEARHRPGALEALVASSRQRNLAVAAGLNFLLVGAGLLLVRQTRRARALAEAQMNFVASVSHELRTPLTVIRGAAHNLTRGVVHDPSRVTQYAGLITQHADQLTEMVGQVLDFAAARKKQLLARPASVELAAVLEEAASASASEVQAAHCALEVDLPTPAPSVLGDGAALRRVFQNLICNAAKHGGAGGWVGVSVAAGDDAESMAEVRVSDCGPGIPEDEQEEVFAPFFRGAAAQENQVRGSGLGLSLVREIVEAHGGSIALESKGGHGATFIVRLPVSA